MLRAPFFFASVLLLAPADAAAGQRHGEFAVATTDSAEVALHAQRLYIRGLTAARLENHEEAVRLFEEANRLSSGEAAVLLSLSESYLALGDGDSALFYAREASKLSRDVHVLHHLARLYLDRRDFASAEAVLNDVLTAHPGDTDALFELARISLAKGDLESAASNYELLLDRVGDDRTIRTQILQIYERLGDEDGIERSFRALIGLDPFNTRYPTLLARRLADGGRLSDAAEVLESAIARVPGDVELLFGLVDIQRRMGNNDAADELASTLFSVEGLTDEQVSNRAAGLYLRAAEDPAIMAGAAGMLKTALEKDPQNADLLVMLGDLEYRNGAFAESAQLLERSLAENPRQLSVWRQACAAYLQADALDEGLRVAEEALLLFPGDLQLVRLAANAEMMLNRNQEAIERFQEGLSILHEDEIDAADLEAEFHGSLGFLYDRTKNYVQSDHHYSSAVRLDSTYAPVLNNYAFSLAERDTLLTESLGMARRAVRIDSANASYLDTLGWILYKLDDIQGAEEWIGKAVRTGDASSTVLEHYGDVLNRLGRVEEAQELWRRAAEKSGGSPSLDEKLDTDG